MSSFSILIYVTESGREIFFLFLILWGHRDEAMLKVYILQNCTYYYIITLQITPCSFYSILPV